MSKKTKKDALKATTHLLAAITAISADENLAGNFIALPDVILDNITDTLMLSIEIGGENQAGSSTTSIIEDNTFKPLFIIGSTETPAALRPCNTLDEKTILIVAEIADTNQDPDNNITTITISLSAAGKTVFKDHHETTVKNEGDIAKFIYKISCHVI